MKRYNGNGASSLVSSPTEIKIYEDRCLSCYETQRFDVIHFYAKKHGLKVSRRRVYVFPELQKEADVFGAPMPFLALNEETLDFYEVGKNMLNDKVLEQFINKGLKWQTK